MCDPATMTALTIASGAASFVGQQQMASAQQDANNQARQLAIRNQNLQIQALNNAEDEDRRRTEEALFDNARAAEAERATAAVAAGESGVAGLSIDALLGDIVRQEAENRNDIITTQDFAQRQRQLDREGIGITTESQVNQLPLVEFPSFFESATATATDAFSTYRRTSKK